MQNAPLRNCVQREELHGLRQNRKWETAVLNETENRCGWAWQDENAEAELIQKNRTQKINQKWINPSIKTNDLKFSENNN